MKIIKYVKMSTEELSNEIAKEKRKIETARETIKLLEKLQIAEKAKQTTTSTLKSTFAKEAIHNGSNIEVH